jgi:hypothetical protein
MPVLCPEATPDKALRIFATLVRDQEVEVQIRLCSPIIWCRGLDLRSESVASERCAGPRLYATRHHPSQLGRELVRWVFVCVASYFTAFLLRFFLRLCSASERFSVLAEMIYRGPWTLYAESKWCVSFSTSKPRTTMTSLIRRRPGLRLDLDDYIQRFRNVCFDGTVRYFDAALKDASL